MQVTRLVRGGVLFTALMDLDGIDNRQKKEGRGQADPNQEETAAADTTNEKTNYFHQFLENHHAGRIDSREREIDCTTAISSIPMERLFVGRALGGHLMAQIPRQQFGFLPSPSPCLDKPNCRKTNGQIDGHPGLL